VEASPRLPAGP